MLFCQPNLKFFSCENFSYAIFPMKQTTLGLYLLIMSRIIFLLMFSSPLYSDNTLGVGLFITLTRPNLYTALNFLLYICLSFSSSLNSGIFSSINPALFSRYQNVLLFEKGTPRSYVPGDGFIPTNRTFMFFENLYLIIKKSRVCNLPAFHFGKWRENMFSRRDLA